MIPDRVYLKLVVNTPELNKKISALRSEHSYPSRANQNTVRKSELHRARQIIDDLEKGGDDCKYYFSKCFTQDPDDNLYYLQDTYKGIIKEMAISYRKSLRLEKLEIDLGIDE